MIETFVNYCKQNFDLNGALYAETYYSLPICLIGCVYSLRAKYFLVCVPVVKRYAFAYMGTNCQSASDTLSDFVKHIDEAGGCGEFAEKVLKNKQKLSGRLKTEICYELAQNLLALNINTLEDFRNFPNTAILENAIKMVKGIGQAGLNYLFMLAGDPNRCKPDVHIHHCVKDALGKDISDSECQELFTSAVALLKKDYPSLTVRKLDGIIWEKYQAHR